MMRPASPASPPPPAAPPEPFSSLAWLLAFPHVVGILCSAYVIWLWAQIMFRRRGNLCGSCRLTYPTCAGDTVLQAAAVVVNKREVELEQGDQSHVDHYLDVAFPARGAWVNALRTAPREVYESATAGSEVSVLHLAANPRHCELEAVVRADAGLLPWKVFAATLVSAMVTGIGLLLAFADTESGSFDGSLGALDVWLAGTALLVVVCFACHGWRPATHDATMEPSPPACLDVSSDRQATSATRCGSSLPQRHRWLRHRDESIETNELVRAEDDGAVASQHETGEDEEDEHEDEEEVAEDAERGAPRMQVTVLEVGAMCCSRESDLIRGKLLQQPGVSRISFNLGKRQVEVTHDGASSPPGAMLRTLNFAFLQVGLPKATLVADGSVPSRESESFIRCKH
tara:strand:- start:599 stop:1798 length:1200 start_codon:yes stop_codon:yes gene_type:complete